ncbi:hypothetical protein DY000_02064231 [Brassica cretica]|uniref:FMN-dependent dehydrogenase domain-containing protein n=1 Tax=Brassica cretica TaxID=69181 RepID=A0ABQ7B1F8_BRACR|nr:hypothetical protein DY000_02064231 [Brassica cretica]
MRKLPCLFWTLKRPQSEGTGKKTLINALSFLGEYASAARAASGSGTIMSLSSWATSSVEEDVKWLQTITNLPLLMKGVLTAEDGEQKPKLNNIQLSSFLH